VLQVQLRPTVLLLLLVVVEPVRPATLCSQHGARSRGSD
jgi:hypothetical protein